MKGHSVAIPFDMNPDISEGQQIDHNTIGVHDSWIEENIKGEHERFYTYSHSENSWVYFYIFKDKIDALAFKLRWI